MHDAEWYRDRMVEEQLFGRGITDQKVLHAFRLVPRDKFIPEYPLSSAYGDYPLPVASGQTISQPYIVAFMCALCRFSGDEKVLEIGTGSGYQTAILSLLAREVFSVEIVPELYNRSATVLRMMNLSNLHLRVSDGYLGWPEEAPFDSIILSAAPGAIPEKLLDQLADGGRIVAPVGTGVQRLLCGRKLGDRFEVQEEGSVRFVPMIQGKKTNSL